MSVGGDERPSIAERELLIAITSHELRTPVTVIKGFADTLADHWDALDSDGRRAAVRVIRQRATDLARLVDQLLAITTAPLRQARHTAVDLDELVREVSHGLGASLRDRLHTRLPGQLPPVYGDRASLAAVVQELITNAGKYSTAAIEVEVTHTDGEVVLRIADHGPGMTPEQYEHAFERSWRAGSAPAAGEDGSGLGLYLVRQIIECQNGRVSLHPRENGGTVAEVRVLRADVVSGGGQSTTEEADGVDGGSRT